MFIVCQYCYGWELTMKIFISMGEIIGIISPQSTSEPGTQLIIRTFHTGGVFSKGIRKVLQRPSSGKVIITCINGYITYIKDRRNRFFI